jgi:hypothetical protein
MQEFYPRDYTSSKLGFVSAYLSARLAVRSSTESDDAALYSVRRPPMLYELSSGCTHAAFAIVRPWNSQNLKPLLLPTSMTATTTVRPAGLAITAVGWTLKSCGRISGTLFRWFKLENGFAVNAADRVS